MAKVVAVPSYARSAYHKVVTMGGRSEYGDFVELVDQVSRGRIPKAETVEQREIICYARHAVEEEKVFPGRVGRNCAIANFAMTELEKRHPNYRRSDGYKSCHELYARIVTGDILSRDHCVKQVSRVWQMAVDTAISGLTGSCIAPSPAIEHFDRIKCVSKPRAGYRHLLLAWINRECFRYATTSTNASAANSSDVSNKTKLSDFEVTSAGIGYRWPDLSAYAVNGAKIIVDKKNKVLHILEQLHLDDLCDCLNSTFGWLNSGTMNGAAINKSIAGADHQAAALSGIDSVMTETRALLHAEDYPQLMNLAKAYKTAYTAALSTVKGKVWNQEVEEFATKNQRILKEESSNKHRWKRHWTDVLLDMNDNMLCSYGTVWNILPGAEAETERAFGRVRDASSAEKKYDPKEYQKFREWSFGEITARVVSENPEEPWEWENVKTKDEVEWKANLLEGKYKPRPAGSKAVAHSGFRWAKSLEMHHFAAKDCTRIIGQRHANRPYKCTKHKDAYKGNELLTALVEGNLFSGMYTPDEVRRAMMRSEFPGDLISEYSAKNENTKQGSMCRDINSLCDFARKVNSELDQNVRQVGVCLQGVTSGMSRAAMEQLMALLMGGKTSDEILASIDISGWSPNMILEHEMEFADFLVSLFAGMRGVSWKKMYLDDPCRIAARRKWFVGDYALADGSIQGWWGTVDTIMHWCIVRYVAANVECASGTPSKVALATLIDDVLMRCTKVKAPIETWLNEVVEKYAELGFETEITKTLCGSTVGCFLNRVYRDAAEIPTFTKIFARVDIERERTLVCISDHLQCAMTSAAGASDRGACPVSCYAWGIFHYLSYVAQRSRKILGEGWEFSMFGAFLPASHGGHGIPGYTAWVTRTATATEDSAFGVLYTINESFIPGMAKRQHAAYVNRALDAPAVARSTLATAEDPYGLKIEDVVNPGARFATVLQTAAEKTVKAESFVKMMDMKRSMAASKLVASVLGATQWHPAIISMWYASTPMALIDSLTVKAEKNEAVLEVNKPRNLPRVKIAVRKDEKIAALQYRRWCDEICGKDTMTLGTSVTDRLSAKRRAALATDNIAFWRYDMFAVEAGIRRNNDRNNHMIAIHYEQGPKREIRTLDEMQYGGKKLTLRRTSAVSPPFEIGAAGIPKESPISRSLSSLMTSMAYACKIHGPNAAELLRKAYCALWFGSAFVDKIAVPVIGIDSSNPLRAASRTKVCQYTLSAWPNGFRAVTVSSNNAIVSFERSNAQVDWLMVTYAMKAAAMTDLWLGANVSQPRYFSPVPGAVGTTSIEPKDVEEDIELDCSAVKSILTTKESEDLTDAMDGLVRTISTSEKFNVVATDDLAALFNHARAAMADKENAWDINRVAQMARPRTLIRPARMGVGAVVARVNPVNDPAMMAVCRHTNKGVVAQALGANAAYGRFVSSFATMAEKMSADQQKAADEIRHWAISTIGIVKANKDDRNLGDQVVTRLHGKMQGQDNGSVITSMKRLMNYLDLESPAVDEANCSYLSASASKHEKKGNDAKEKHLKIYHTMKAVCMRARLRARMTAAQEHETWYAMASAVADRARKDKVEDVAQFIESSLTNIGMICSKEDFVGPWKGQSGSKVKGAYTLALNNVWEFFVHDEVLDAVQASVAHTAASSPAKILDPEAFRTFDDSSVRALHAALNAAAETDDMSRAEMISKLTPEELTRVQDDWDDEAVETYYNYCIGRRGQTEAAQDAMLRVMTDSPRRAPAKADHTGSTPKSGS